MRISDKTNPKGLWESSHELLMYTAERLCVGSALLSLADWDLPVSSAVDYLLLNQLGHFPKWAQNAGYTKGDKVARELWIRMFSEMRSYQSDAFHSAVSGEEWGMMFHHLDVGQPDENTHDWERAGAPTLETCIAAHEHNIIVGVNTIAGVGAMAPADTKQNKEACQALSDACTDALQARFDHLLHALKFKPVIRSSHLIPEANGKWAVVAAINWTRVLFRLSVEFDLLKATGQDTLIVGTLHNMIQLYLRKCPFYRLQAIVSN
ncbi:MAG: hypothetical protein Q7R39_09905 [Dehalococcoidia bacterium]|nr:hypothetical protein [Dehalococcoidia bacterium]